MKYDYIIGGAGLSGLTLAWQMAKHNILDDKQLLIIDADKKEANDRTWCFWAQPEMWITELPIKQSWNKAQVKGTDFDLVQDLSPYRYYKIEGLDYYDFIKKELKEYPQVTFIQDVILSEDSKQKIVTTQESSYDYSEYFFKSYFYPDELKSIQNPKKHFIWQHFYGWKIKTKEIAFDPKVITYMDMNVAEEIKGLSFAYILPDSQYEAMVEYTLFSAQLWSEEDYKNALIDYIRNNLGITEYEIEEIEFNKIPMTNASFSQRSKSIVPIGTLAGTVKPSTGYSFVRNYQHIQQIIKSLKSNKDDFAINSSVKFKFYDEVLINVLHTSKSSGHQVFGNLYKKNKLPQLLKFLNEETNLLEDLRIMNTVPKWPFIKAVAEELVK
ncbi:lycopene cyclase family protein [Marivirga arenosa]|uniref:Lycopene cyclase family protein n=1 Tax=Marivirga arenosa TaxID=3059076 RepID=A0AA51X3P3_9BACT|nr:lycopene cyclase family protein [Marivirga sp. BKB1-2]WNB16899.1 lycopene cyclase family protein [Marivirga sp. BKB1-2]